MEPVSIPVCALRPSAKNLARMARMFACSQHTNSTVSLNSNKGTVTLVFAVATTFNG